jgi:hypothetical protein
MASLTLGDLPVVVAETQAVPVDNDISFTLGLPRLKDTAIYRENKPYREVKIKVTVGSIQFSVAGIVGADNPVITTTSPEITLTLYDGDVLYWKAAAQNDAFIIYG